LRPRCLGGRLLQVGVCGAMGWFDSVKNAVQDAAIDTVGFAASTGGACLGTAGSAIAGGALTLADIVTLGKVDSIGDMRDEQFEAVVDGMGDIKAGMAAFTSKTEWYRTDPPAGHLADWMAALPDDVPVTDIFIPGTHDSLATSGGDLAECQSWDLAQQLHAGLRVFDIRPKHDNDDLPIFHGIIRMPTDFDSCAQILEDFVTKHPTEAVFIRVKREGEAGAHECDFDKAATSRMKTCEVWHRACPRWKNLSEYRGKITCLAQCSHLRLYRHPIDCQDVYNTGDENEKFAKIVEHAQKPREEGTMYISFCSAVGQDGRVCFKAPGAVAYDVNKMVMEGLGSFNPGIYLFDFPGNSLVQAVIDRNPKK